MRTLLFTALFAFWGAFSWGFAGSPPFFSEIRQQTTSLSCNLPAPANASVVEVSTNWAIIQWDAVPGASYYQVRAFDQSNNQVFAAIVPSSFNPSVQVNSLQPGQSYNISIQSACSQNEISPQIKWLGVTTVIVDLVVQNQNGPNYLGSGILINNCGPNGIGGLNYNCSYSSFSHPLIFGELENSQGRYVRFYVSFQAAQLKYVVGMVPMNLYNENSIEGSILLTPDGEAEGQHIDYIKYSLNQNEQLKLYFSFVPFNSNASSINVNLTGGQPYNLKLKVSGSQFRNEGTLLLPTPTLIHTIFPVELPTPPTTPSLLQLFDLNGKLVKEQDFPAQQQSLQLNVADLRPGFYLARISVDGLVETRKVIKAE